MAKTAVDFIIDNSRYSATFSSTAAANAFVKEASTKYGNRFTDLFRRQPKEDVQLHGRAPVGLMGELMAEAAREKREKAEKEQQSQAYHGASSEACDSFDGEAGGECRKCGFIAYEHPDHVKKTLGEEQKQAGEGISKDDETLEKEAAESKEAAINFFFPGQVLREFYPDLQHEIVDYPNATNAPMKTPEVIGEADELDNAVDAMLEPGTLEAVEDVIPIAAGYVSTDPAGAMGIGRDGKPQVLDGVPLRKENDIRGPMFLEEFYDQYNGIPGEALMMASVKTAAADEAKQFGLFLQKVCGEIAATMVAAFKVTQRPLLDKVPGEGEVQLAQIEQPAGLASFATVNTASRVKYLMDKLTDSEIQDAVNEAFAQAAVWHEGPSGGFVYEIFVRAETIDTDSMIMKYKFVAGTKE
jgi:hypothetical protein